jgi:hypothetical protein
MTERQNTVVATTPVALALVVGYLCPYRGAGEGDLRIPPLYRSVPTLGGGA